ncbi:hypothetical protein [Pseudomonas syringae]|uniref:hypothetical protein n=1 Tax=Pseudomonas syringae TaxID=317 RepID=UPI000F004936|nr:hypothetical protein [Pseudomonas syringae]MDH4602338.1 hypothetical protein [Pseudomonas syringae pv. papulans]
MVSKPSFSRAGNEKGNALLNVAIAIFVTSLVSVLGASKYVTLVNDAAAEATGRYLLTVRGGVQEALTQYYDALTLVDTSSAPSGLYPNAPAWAKFTGNIQTISVQDLKASQLLRGDFPSRPPLGRSVQIRLIRQNCPGTSCQLRAFAYTCWPVSTARSPANADITTCPAEPAGWRANGSIVGGVIMAMNGYGGSNSINAARINGPLLDLPSSDLGFSSRGHAVIAASLDSTMFSQFVRQGDTRHIFLNNNLSVVGQIETDRGLVIDTNIPVGSACSVPGMYATSSRDSLVTCMGGVWFEMANHTVMGAQSLPNGAQVVSPTCPSPMQPFAYTSLESLDVTMTGSDINVRGNMTGTIVGSGSTSQSGNVSVNGTYSGTTQSSQDSAIRVAQGATISGGRVVITPADPRARALVVQGCRY